ncbi:uncharacterized protein [Palaemon carinicauda]|uniref:uncharacterized protein n=1 Tax=Palaemon carinicauda TaxID=392227 RepID=UPI0035B5B300
MKPNVQEKELKIIGNKSWNDLLPYIPDVSHVEQMTVIIKFVQFDEDNAVIALRELFLGYVPLQETTGAFMAENILLYVFFSASTHRWDVLKRHVQSLTAKPLSETQWESRVDSLKPIRYQIVDIHDVLTEMTTDSTLLGSSGNSTRAEAKSLANDSVHIRKKKRQFNYEGEDTPVQNAKVNFKVNFYFAVLDVAINSVLERFQQLQQMKSVFGCFLYDLKSLNGITNTQFMEHCTKLETMLRDGESKDIDATDLCHELQAVARRLQLDTVTPLDVLKFICEQGLVHSVPNTFVALRILLTLSVTVASDDNKAAFYTQLDRTIQVVPANDKLVVLGDFNALVGKDHRLWDGIIGHHGIGNCNANCQLLLGLCAEHQLVVTNTIFQLPK